MFQVFSHSLVRFRQYNYFEWLGLGKKSWLGLGLTLKLIRQR